MICKSFINSKWQSGPHTVADTNTSESLDSIGKCSYASKQRLAVGMKKMAGALCVDHTTDGSYQIESSVVQRQHYVNLEYVGIAAADWNTTMVHVK
jgi:hypothetical protein